MKKFFLPILAMVCAGAAFTSCSDDDYSAGPLSDGAYFPTNTVTNYTNLFRDASVIEIPVMRNGDAEAASFALRLDDPSGMFSVPATVNFAAGQSETLVPITFDGEALALSDYKVVLSIAENAFPYGIDDLTLTIGLDGSLRWAPMGMGKYVDGFLAPIYGFEAVEQEVRVEQNLGTKGLYRIVNAYGADSPYVGYFEKYPENDSYLEIDATNPNFVIIEPQSLGVDLGYGNTVVLSSNYYFTEIAGNPAAAVVAAGYNGTLVNGVITFTVKGLMIQDDEGLGYTNGDGGFRLELPTDDEE